MLKSDYFLGDVLQVMGHGQASCRSLFELSLEREEVTGQRLRCFLHVRNSLRHHLIDELFQHLDASVQDRHDANLDEVVNCFNL